MASTCSAEASAAPGVPDVMLVMLSTGSARSYDGPPGRGRGVAPVAAGVLDHRGEVVTGADSSDGAGGTGRAVRLVGVTSGSSSSRGRSVVGSGSGVRVGGAVVVVPVVGSVVGEAVVVLVDGGGVEVDAWAGDVLSAFVAMARSSGRVTRTARRIARRGPVMATFWGHDVPPHMAFGR